LPGVDRLILISSILTGITPLNHRNVLAMPTSAIIMTIIAGILDILGVALLLMQTFNDDFP